MTSKNRQLTKALQSVLDSELTSARLTLAHLVIIGIPVLWGIKPLWDSSIHSWMGAKILKGFSPASTMFNDRILSEDGRFASSLEALAVHDMGWHFIYPYELSFVAWFVLRNSERGIQHFHETLTMCSFATLLFMSMLQCVHPKWSFAPFEPNFFARMVFCHLIAISVSWGSISWRGRSSPVLSNSQRHEEWLAKSARWSIPGMALFTGATVSGLLVAASIQGLVAKEGGLETNSVRSEVFQTSFFLATFHLVVHAFLLYRLRYNVMEAHQIKYVCFYKFVVHLMVPLFWLPELDPFVHVDRWLTLGTHLFLAVIYWLGFRYAGLGDAVAKILVGEKSG